MLKFFTNVHNFEKSCQIPPGSNAPVEISLSCVLVWLFFSSPLCFDQTAQLNYYWMNGHKDATHLISPNTPPQNGLVQKVV